MAERITQRQFYIWHISKCLKWHTNSLAYDWKTSKFDLNPSELVIHVLENRYRLFAVQRSVTILDTQWCKMLNILFMTYPCPVASPPSSLPHHTWDHRICSTVKSGKSCVGVSIAALRGELSWVMQCKPSDIIPTLPTCGLTWSYSDNWSMSLGNGLNKGGRKRRGLTFRLFLVGCDGAYEVLGSHVDLRITVLTYDLQGGKVAENLVGSGVGSYPILILHHLKIKSHTLSIVQTDWLKTKDNSPTLSVTLKRIFSWLENSNVDLIER